MTVKHYRELVAWQKAMDLAEAIHLTTRQFPRDEIYGLTSQLRRAAVSVPSNIAEGQGRGSSREFFHFLGISYGSLQELETQILIAERLKYMELAECDHLLSHSAEVGRLTNGLLRSLSQRLTTDH